MRSCGAGTARKNYKIPHPGLAPENTKKIPKNANMAQEFSICVVFFFRFFGGQPGVLDFVIFSYFFVFPASGKANGGVFGRGFSNNRFVLKPDVAIASEVSILSKNSLAITDFHAKKTQHVQLFENPLSGTPPFAIPNLGSVPAPQDRKCGVYFVVCFVAWMGCIFRTVRRMIPSLGMDHGCRDGLCLPFLVAAVGVSLDQLLKGDKDITYLTFSPNDELF